MAVVEVRLEHVLVDGVALLRVDLARVLLGKPVEGLLDRDAHRSPGALLLAPVEHELLALEDREDLLGDALDLLLLIGVEVRSRAGEQVEDRELLLGEPGGDSACLLLGQRVAQLDELVEVLLDVQAAGVVLRRGGAESARTGPRAWG